MAQNKTKTSSNVAQILVIIFVVISVILIVVDLRATVAAELQTQNEAAEFVGYKPTPSPTPTLTAEELQEILRDNPVGEDGN